MVPTVSTLNGPLRKMMHFIIILSFLLFKILILDSHDKNSPLNGEFLSWSRVTMVRIFHLKYSSFHYKPFITM